MKITEILAPWTITLDRETNPTYVVTPFFNLQENNFELSIQQTKTTCQQWQCVQVIFNLGGGVCATIQNRTDMILFSGGLVDFTSNPPSITGSWKNIAQATCGRWKGSLSNPNPNPVIPETLYWTFLINLPSGPPPLDTSFVIEFEYQTAFDNYDCSVFGTDSNEWACSADFSQGSVSIQIYRVQGKNLEMFCLTGGLLVGDMRRLACCGKASRGVLPLSDLCKDDYERLVPADGTWVGSPGAPNPNVAPTSTIPPAQIEKSREQPGAKAATNLDEIENLDQHLARLARQIRPKN